MHRGLPEPNGQGNYWMLGCSALVFFKNRYWRTTVYLSIACMFIRYRTRAVMRTILGRD
jgi:hypothetical protein